MVDPQGYVRAKDVRYETLSDAKAIQHAVYRRTDATTCDSSTEMANQLSYVGEIVKPGYIVAVLMNSLPESYLPMVTMLKGHKEEELTANYVAAKLEDEYECRQEVGTNRHDDNKACRRQEK